MTDRRGFTLVELLVAIVIGGIVVSVLFQMIAGQGRFVEVQSAREEVQQNTRATLELIGSELRSLPDSSALVQASAEEVTLRTPRIWGVVCAAPGGAALEVVFPAIPGASWAVNRGTGVTVRLLLSDADTIWAHAPVTSIGAPSAACGGTTLPAGAEQRRVNLSALPQHAGVSADVGDVLYLGDEISYRSGTSSAVPGLWVQRRIGSGGGSSYQPLAGPIEEGSGLRFDYFAGTSTTPLPTPIMDPATRASVTRVQVSVEAISRNLAAGERQTKADTLIVSLRNRM